MSETTLPLPQPQPQPQTPPPHHDSNPTPQPISTTITTTTDLSIPSPPTKMTLRPRKIPKLSPQSTATNTKTPPNHNSLIPKIISRSLSCSGEIETALIHLKTADPLLTPLITTHQPPKFDSSQPPFLALSKSILYQQLAFKAGTSIYTRFLSLCGGDSSVLPETVLSLTPHQLRQIGVSGRKSSYLHDLARKYQNGILSDSSILEMDDKSLFTMLTMVNGIGSWSVHMFMIFSLHRPDVLPIHDLGVRKGVQIHFGLEEVPRPSQMEQLCEKWRPYRSVASWYMWRLAEAKGAPSSARNVAGVSLQMQQQEQQLIQQQQQQQQQQFMDPINGILNLGACTWGTSMPNCQ